MDAIAPVARNEPARREILARQGLRLPAVTLKQLQRAGIYCQPTISVEHQRVTNEWVLRGLESGGAVVDIGAYTSFVRADGGALSWLQRVDSIGVNAVHAIAIAPIMLRLEMIRIGRTYDLLITRHCLPNAEPNRRPRLESTILFYGRRGTLELELWGKDARFRGAVCPVFYNRAGEALPVPPEFVWAVATLTAAVCCVGCRHCHVLEPALFEGKFSIAS